MKNIFKFFRKMGWHRRQTIKVILTFLVAFFIACGLIQIPAFPQFVQSQANPQILIEQSRKLYDEGNFTEAATVLQQAVEVFRAKGDRLGEAIALSNLSLTFKQLGQLEKAYSYITESLKILTDSELKTQNSELVLAQTLDIQGNLQLELGKAQQALETWKQTDKIYDRIGDKNGQIRSQINIAQAQQALGMYRQARTTLEQVNKILETQPDSITKATALRSLGDVLQLIGDLDNSLKFLQQSRNIAEKLKSPSEISATLLSLGNTLVALGKRSITTENNILQEQSTPLGCINRPASGDALNFYQQAAQSYEQAVNNSTSILTQTQAQLNHFSVLIQLNKWLEAQKLSAEIQSKLSNAPLSHSTISAQINLAQKLVCFKQATGADVPGWKEIAHNFAVAIQQAKSINDNRSEAYALGALGGLYLKTQNFNYAEETTQKALLLAQNIKAEDIAYLWQWQLGYILRSKGDVKGAIASYTEAVNSLKSLRSDLVALNPDVQFSFRDNVEPVYRQLVDLLLRSDNNSPVNQNNLKQARDVIEALQLSELENFFREACLQAKPQQIDEIVDKTDPTAAVLYPIILKDRLEIILKLPTDSELRHFTTYKSQIELESTLEKLQQYLKEPDQINQVKNISGQVYSWLIEPMMNELGKRQIKTLVFVLDGYLRNIPMSVLYDNESQKYLIQKYAIAVAPGLQLVDPKPLERGKLYALIGGVSEERQIEGKKFTPLENVKLELQEIKSGVPRSQQLINQSFTESDLKNQIKSVPFSVVHFATHGQFSSNANETFILTWNELLKVRKFDNLLRLRDPSESRAIELLVLSACQTATGDRRAALGLAGIAVRAGARSTLATLWSVDDRSTAELMSQFYQEFAKAQVTKAEALRRAQLTLLTNYEIPYFWAPYVLVGNWL